jgi:hypothetical protein
MGIINKLRPTPMQKLEKSSVTNFFIKTFPLSKSLSKIYERNLNIYLADWKLRLLFVLQKIILIHMRVRWIKIKAFSLRPECN